MGVIIIIPCQLTFSPAHKTGLNKMVKITFIISNYSLQHFNSKKANIIEVLFLSLSIIYLDKISRPIPNLRMLPIQRDSFFL